MIFQKQVSKKQYYREILSLLTLFKFSDFELDILVTMFMSNMLEVNIDSREQIRKVLNKDKFITNNYIKRLRNKGVLIDNPNTNRTYLINPVITQMIKEGKVTFEFNINE